MREPHEGAWIYLSAVSREPLAEGVREVCGRHGWPVLAASEQPAPRRRQALALADACIVELAGGAEAEAELALALAKGRPVIALRSQDAHDRVLPAQIVRDSARVSDLSYRDLDDCFAALDLLLGDEAWQEQVTRAVPSG